MNFFLRGAVVGFAIAAPVGPIGLLCIRRTLTDGRARGFVSGLGAATADAFYGAVAAFGLTAVSGALVEHRFAVRLAGGLFLCGLGASIFRSRVADRPASARARGFASDYAATLFLTLTNPATILSFAAVFAGAGLAAAGAGFGAAWAMVAGVFCGSASWWLTLSFGVALLRERLSARLVWVNRLSGAALFCFGLAVVGSAFQM